MREYFDSNFIWKKKDVSYHRVSLIPTFKGLGISLTPNGIISSIEPNSPSDRAGLRKDKRIVEVNGINVRDRSNKEIATIIKEHENNLVIGVLDTHRNDGYSPDSYGPAVASSSQIRSSSNTNLRNIVDEAIVSSKPLQSSQPLTQQQPPMSGSTTHLKSIVGEIIQSSSGPAAPTHIPDSESMPHIKSMLAEITRMQAPTSTYISSAVPLSSQRQSGLIENKQKITNKLSLIK